MRSKLTAGVLFASGATLPGCPGGEQGSSGSTADATDTSTGSGSSEESGGASTSTTTTTAGNDDTTTGASTGASTTSEITTDASSTTEATTEASTGASSTGDASTGADTTEGGSSGAPGACGDGAVDPGEACDDGNSDEADACSTQCELNKALSVTMGYEYTCASISGETVKCWGRNDSGQLGLGDIAPRGDEPGEMGDALPAVDLGTGRTATAITAGYRHTCALLDDGSVKCWGWNGGWLGLEDNLDRGDGPGEMGDALPAVDLGAGRTATAISAGERHTCALLDDGSVKCWGGNTYGQLAHDGVNNIGDNAGEMGDDLPPIDLGTGRTATAVTTGAHHTCASLDDGATKCWGINVNGTLGQGDTVNRGSHAYDRGDDLDPIALPPRGLLTGTLADAVTGEAVVGGFVAVLRTADFSLAAAAITGPASDWEADVAPGGYFLYQVDPTARHLEGFLESVPGVPFLVEVGDGENVDLGALWITGPTRGSFSGTVTDDASGRPLAGAWVLAIGPAGLVGGAVTAADGTYTVTDLPVGTYRATFVDGEARRLQEYWDDSLTYDGGATLNVTAGGNTPGIDAALDRP